MAGIFKDYKKFRSISHVNGIERVFDSILLLLRVAAPSFWLRSVLPSSRGPHRRVRDNAIDIYCVVETLLLVLLLTAADPSLVSVCLAAFILFEIFLTVGNIVFIGKFRELHAEPASIERSIILLFMNLIEVVLSFAIFYRYSLGIGPSDAFFQSALVLGTVGYPDDLKGNHKLIVALQVFLDMTLVVLLLSSFVSQVGLFNRKVRTLSKNSRDDT